MVSPCIPSIFQCCTRFQPQRLPDCSTDRVASVWCIALRNPHANSKNLGGPSSGATSMQTRVSNTCTDAMTHLSVQPQDVTRIPVGYNIPIRAVEQTLSLSAITFPSVVPKLRPMSMSKYLWDPMGSFLAVIHLPRFEKMKSQRLPQVYSGHQELLMNYIFGPQLWSS